MHTTELFFDIETIPSQLPGIREEIAAGVTAPGQYSKPESIAKWLEENREAAAEAEWLKTSFDGGLGQVCVIGWAIGDDAPKSLQVADLGQEAERELLAEFFGVVQRAGSGLRFVGHNAIGFDLKFMWKRAMVLGIKPPWTFPRAPKPWAENVADTMLMWDGDQRAGGSMDRLCKLLGIPGKGDMDGSKVWPMVRDGRIEEVAAYCRGDVARTRAMYRRMTFTEKMDLPF